MGQLARFTGHRIYNRGVAMALHPDPELRAYARDVANCARRLGLELAPLADDPQPAQLVTARLCNRRLCPFCEWRRARVLRRRILTGLEAYSANHPQHGALLLTLTVRNCPIADLRQTIQEMNRAWHRMTTMGWFPSAAWFRRLEVTVKLRGDSHSSVSPEDARRHITADYSSSVESVHPHFHVLILVPPSYWSHGYIRQSRWQQEWMMAARLDYPPVVDVRRVRSRKNPSEGAAVSSVSAVCEVSKYLAKGADLVRLGPDLLPFHHQIRGLRSFALSHELSAYINAADIAAGELLDSPLAKDRLTEGPMSLIAEWIDSLQEYRIAP